MIADFVDLLYRLIFDACSYLCHQMPERSLIFGVRLPLCFRCTGIYAGLALGLIYLYFRYRKTVTKYPSRRYVLLMVFCVVLLPLDIFPVLIDLIPDESTVFSNIRRAVTGLFFGAGLSLFVYPSLVVLSLRKGELLNN
ncbi:MAG: DUF2085 domain-containing protein [Planctomycetes bacterium]|nr:DUF2085 domain-containing protein [Planctomycetota bacterium]